MLLLFPGVCFISVLDKILSATFQGIERKLAWVINYFQMLEDQRISLCFSFSMVYFGPITPSPPTHLLLPPSPPPYPSWGVAPFLPVVLCFETQMLLSLPGEGEHLLLSTSAMVVWSLLFVSLQQNC